MEHNNETKRHFAQQLIEAGQQMLREIESEADADVTKWCYQDGYWQWQNSKGQRHRENGPAIEYPNGSKTWYLNGKLHREDGAAIERADGSKEWWVNGEWQRTEWRNEEGQLHREDGPAVEWGSRHREDGPAIEWPGGRKDWYLNGKRHREDGPAIEHPNGYKEWWLNGQHKDEYLAGGTASSIEKMGELVGGLIAQAQAARNSI